MRRQQGRGVKQWALSAQKPRGIRPLCGKCRERIQDGDIRATRANQQQGHYIHVDCPPPQALRS
eukprot:7240384-Alexandrium_andersonii.AAC.1